jgi:hypothetical protein
MTVIRVWTVVLGATLLGGCAPEARPPAIASSSSGYFASTDWGAPRAVGTEFSGHVQWARVDPRFRNDVDELAIDVDNWQRSDGSVSNAAPLLLQLADAVDAMPRGERVGPFRDTAAVRANAVELGGSSMNGFNQRRTVRESLLLLHRQLAADANGAYAADPMLLVAVEDMRQAAAGISDSGPESSVELGLVAARDAMKAFAEALARGRVVPSD